MSILNLKLVVHFHKDQEFICWSQVIDLKNWRCIRSVEGTNSIQLYTQEFELYEIFDTSLTEFLQVIQSNPDIEKEGNYIMTSLLCNICGGTGVSDWISNIRKRPISDRSSVDVTDFKRDEKRVYYKNDYINDDKLVKIKSYYSVAYIDPNLKGIELCKSCRGTGFFDISSLKKSELIYLP